MLKLERGLLLVLLFSLAYFLPFVKGPYMGQDAIGYFHAADNILRTPLDPYSSPFLCEGNDLRQRLVNLGNGPVVPYYIAFVKLLFGGGETKMHLAFYLFYLVAIYSVYFLAKKAVGSGTLAALIFAANPFVIESALTTMADLPLTAMFLLSIVLMMEGVDDESKSKLFFSEVLAGLAILTKYPGMSLLPLFAVYLLLKRKLKYLPYILVPIAMFLLWGLHNAIFYGMLHFLTNVGLTGIGTQYDKIAGTFAGLLYGRALSSAIFTVEFLVGNNPALSIVTSIFLGLFPLAVILAYAGKSVRRVLALLAFSLVLVLAVGYLAPYGRVPAIPVTLSFAGGVFVAAVVFADEVIAKISGWASRGKETDRLFLAIAAFILVASYIFTMPTFIPRYGLQLFALFSVFFADKMQNTRIPPKLLPAIFASFVVLGLAYVYPTYSYSTASKAQADLGASLYSRSDTFACDAAGPYGLYLENNGFKIPCLKGAPVAPGDRILGSSSACGLNEVKGYADGLGVSASEVGRWYMGPGKDVRYTVYTLTEPD